MKLENKILKGLKVGRKQTSGIMSVYPLIGEDLRVNLATFDDIEFGGTVNYGQMKFINKSDKPFLLPTCHSIMTKQSAQDHSTTYSSLLKSGNNVLKNTCCIQQTQGGYINGEQVKKDNEIFSFLPLDLRRNILFNTSSIENDMSFHRLWGYIVDFQRELVNKAEGNLIYFFTKYLTKLAKFNAEFELVEGQRGAIITFNDEIVGIEISPTHNYFKNIWKPLIRDCYGSAMIQLAETNIKETFNNSNQLDLSNCNDLKSIINTVNKDFLDSQAKLLLKLVNISDIDFNEVTKGNFLKANSTKDFEYKIAIDKTKKYGFELFEDKENLIYLSLIKNK